MRVYRLTCTVSRSLRTIQQSIVTRRPCPLYLTRHSGSRRPRWALARGRGVRRVLRMRRSRRLKCKVISIACWRCWVSRPSPSGKRGCGRWGISIMASWPGGTRTPRRSCRTRGRPCWPRWRYGSSPPRRASLQLARHRRSTTPCCTPTSVTSRTSSNPRWLRR